MPDGSQIVWEMISGESKISEPQHAIRALKAGRPYRGLCASHTIRERIRRHFREAGIEEDATTMRLLIPEDITQ
jgi:hypothetical protein